MTNADNVFIVPQAHVYPDMNKYRELLAAIMSEYVYPLAFRYYRPYFDKQL